MKHVHSTFTVSCEKSATVSFAPSIKKDIVVFATRFRARVFFKSNLLSCFWINLALAVYLNLSQLIYNFL